MAIRQFLRFLALVCAVAVAGLHAQEKVQFPSLDTWGFSEPLTIDGYLFKPKTDKRYSLVMLFHGCGGALNSRGEIADERFLEVASMLNGMGYGVLLVDSFNPRGEISICSTPLKDRKIGASQRWMDAFGALAWARARPEQFNPKVGVIGMSHGGTSALDVMDANLPPMQDGITGFAAAISMYPGCGATWKRKPEYKAYGPLLLLLGELDDWTPIETCVKIAERSQARGEPIEMVVYPGAHHGFNTSKPVTTKAVQGDKMVHLGGNPEAYADSTKRIKAFFDKHLH